MPPLRAAIVAAVSDPKQAAADKASIPDQIRDSRRLCEVRDWTPAAEIIIPGHSRNYNWLHEIVRDCPEYGEMIDLIEAGAVDLIVCRDYDRLWRTDALRAQVTALCREHGVQVYSINQPVEPTPPGKAGQSDTGRLSEVLFGYIAEQENRTRVRRRMIGMANRIARGLDGFGKCIPYGYERVEGNPVLQVIPAEAAIVRWIYACYLEGESMYAIAEGLNERSVPPPYATRPHLAKLVRRFCWTISSISGILSQEFYAGGVHYGEFRNPTGLHETIIAREDWERCGAIRRLHLKRSRTIHFNPFAGMGRCGLCGYAMGFHARPRERSAVMRCSHYMASHGKQCQANGRSIRKVRVQVIAAIQDAIRDPAAFLEARRQQHEVGATRERLNAIGAEVEELRAAQVRWDAVYERGGMGVDQYMAHIDRLNAAIAIRESDRRDLEELAANEARASAKLADLAPYADRLADMTDEELRPIYVSLIRELRFYPRREPDIIWW